jgi:hypothetical protein
MPYNVRQRTNINLLNRFNEAADRNSSPPSNGQRYGSLGLVSIPGLRRSNAITREEEEAFNNTGYIGGQAMGYLDPFDSPPR